MEILKLISRIIALPLLLLVLLYQKTLSPDHGIFKFLFSYGYCKFHPTCSEYAVMVLQDQGVVGIPKIINRLLRCRPSVVGGIDHP